MAHSQSKIVLSKDRARRFSLERQLLTSTKIPKGKPGTLRVIDRLGYVQIDTISVIERSHHIVLHTRLSDYRKEYLHELQAKDKKIFEYWAHAASFIPMKDYRYYLRTIQKKPKPGSWTDKWTKENSTVLRAVRKRVEKEGPLTPSDFGDEEKRKRGPWWDWKPAKAALEVLFWRGELMIKERRNFQRVYDLTERVLPKGLNDSLPTEEEEKKFFVRRALISLGVATVQDVNRYIGVSGRLNEWLTSMRKAGEIAEVEIETLKKPYYALTEDLSDLLNYETEFDDRVHVLSPFDNSIILRDRTRELFDFEYSLECYVPQNKRKYGYFCLPILWHCQLVGRIDPKADRLRKVLLINNIQLEKIIDASRYFLPALAAALNALCRFNACEHIELNAKLPKNLSRKLSCNLI